MFIRLNKAKILRSASCLLFLFVVAKPIDLTWLFCSLCRKSHKTNPLQLFHIHCLCQWQFQVLFFFKKSNHWRSSIICDIAGAVGGLPFIPGPWRGVLLRLPATISVSPHSQELPSSPWGLLPGLGSAKAAAKSICFFSFLLSSQ